MIPPKARESRKMKAVKLSKNLESIYKEGKCRECSVVVTPMDFAKILGKFTKVKIKYESSSKPTAKRNLNQVSPTSRLKSNENGKLPLRRTAYNPHPGLTGPKKTKVETTPSISKNILKENNKLKKTILNFDLDTNEEINIYNTNIKLISRKKLYHIVFENPKTKKKEVKSKISLEDLIPDITSDMLPSEYWCIDYFPKHGEPKNDKVYDRIAAELEDLMYDEKKSGRVAKDDKTDEFPSIMDILNDNPKVNSNNIKSQDSTVSLESNDVEAMLLGKSDTKSIEPAAPMEVDSTDVSSYLAGVHPLPSVPAIDNKNGEKPKELASMDESPDSPSILDENPQKESTPSELTENAKSSATQNENVTDKTSKIDENDNTNSDNRNNLPHSRAGVTQVIFKKNVNGTCLKSVICPKNLKYNVCMLGKPVELLGAPKVISSLEDLQVLLQIVDESNLDNLYVLH